MSRRSTLVAVPVLMLVAACGSASTPAAAHPTPSAGARQALLASVEKTSSQSFLADMTADESFTVTGSDAASLGELNGQTIPITIQMAAENPQRMRIAVHLNVAGTVVSVVALTYDGATYVSSDGGATFKAGPALGSGVDQFASDNALTYLQSLGSVTDEGPGTADGIAVERYSAQMDAAKTLAVMKSALASQSPEAQQLFSSLNFKSGTITVTLDHQGRIVTEQGPIEVIATLSTLDPNSSGTHIDIKVLVDAHFHDYGSTVTVTKPAVLAAS